MAWAEAFLHAKFHLDPTNHLATIYQHHRQTGQRSDSIVQTILQTVAQNGLTDQCAIFVVDLGSINSVVFTRWRQCALMGGHMVKAHWHHLAYTNEPSVCCGDAALCSEYDSLLVALMFDVTGFSEIVSSN